MSPPAGATECTEQRVTPFAPAGLAPINIENAGLMLGATIFRASGAPCCYSILALRRGSARWNKIFRFIESKSLSHLVPQQQEIDAHLKNDRPDG